MYEPIALNIRLPSKNKKEVEKLPATGTYGFQPPFFYALKFDVLFDLVMNLGVVSAPVCKDICSH